jgi:hypothetical protein
MGLFRKGDGVSVPGGISRGLLDPDGPAHVPAGTRGVVTGERTTWSKGQTHDVQFDRGGHVKNVAADSLTYSPESELSTGIVGYMVIVLGIVVVLSFGGLWVGAHIGALEKWPRGFQQDKTEAGFILALCLGVALWGIFVMKSRPVVGVLLLAVGVTCLYTLPRAAERTLVGSWRVQQRLIGDTALVARTFDGWLGSRGESRCDELLPAFRTWLFGNRRRCVAYEVGKRWTADLTNAHATSATSKVIEEQLAGDGAPGEVRIAIVRFHGTWRIAYAPLPQILSPAGPESARRWHAPAGAPISRGYRHPF